MDLTLSLTHACNLACTYCYAGPQAPRSMTWEVAERALDLTFGAPARRVQLGFFGGEPLIEWDLLVRCTEQAEERAANAGVELAPTVTTNGILLTAGRLRWLADHGFTPALSLDGNRAMHEATRPLAGGGSSFDACLRGLHRALDVFPELEVIVVPDPANVAHLAAGVRFLLEEVGVRRVSVNPNFGAPFTERGAAALRAAFEALGDLYLEQYRSGVELHLSFVDAKIITRLKEGYEHCDRCSFGEREVAVAPSGRIYPCERLIGTDPPGAEMCIGDVFHGFDDERRRRLIARRGNADEQCRECSIRDRCMNWCGCVNYATTGMIDRAHASLCHHERLSVEVADRVASTLFAEGCQPFFRRFYYELEMA